MLKTPFAVDLSNFFDNSRNIGRTAKEIVKGAYRASREETRLKNSLDFSSVTRHTEISVSKGLEPYLSWITNPEYRVYLTR